MAAHTPDFIGPASFTDPDLALAQAQLIYDRGIAHLRQALSLIHI